MRWWRGLAGGYNEAITYICFMKWIYLIPVLLFCCHMVSAQNHDDLIQAHIEAVGGEKNWQNVKTFHVEGNIESEGLTIHTTKNVIRGRAWRNDLLFDGKVEALKNTKFFITILNDKGWKYLPDSKDNKPEELVANEILLYKEDMDFEDPFVRYKEKGTNISYLGTENILNRDYDKFAVSFKSGKQEYIYLNAGDHLIAKRVLVNEDAEDVKEYGDYVKLECGIYYPNYIRTGLGEIFIKKVIVNQEMTDAIFENIKN